MHARKPRSLYDPHPSIQMIQEWITTLKAKTGRSLPEWLKFINKEGPEGEAARRDWLKKQHKVSTWSAVWLAERSLGKGDEEDTPEKYLATAAVYVENMYAGKPGLRPLHDRLMQLARELGKDVKVCPCKTIVPFYRNHVFAQIKPSTRTRLDLGLALGALIKQGKARFPARLIDTGGFAKKDRITHRIAVSSPEDIDDDLIAWLQRAYQLDA